MSKLCIECAVFPVDHDVFRGISLEMVKELMASPVVVDRKNLFEGGEGIVCLGIGKAGVVTRSIGDPSYEPAEYNRYCLTGEFAPDRRNLQV